MEWTQAHCKPPLDDKEFDKLFEQSLLFISENNRHEKGKAGVSEQEASETKIKKFDSKSANPDTIKTCFVHKYSGVSHLLKQ